MLETSKKVAVIVREASQSYLSATVDMETAISLIAVASEDPGNWEEMEDNWPRYRTSAVCEFASSLPLVAVGQRVALAAIAKLRVWVVIDLVQKRIHTGRDFPPLGRDARFTMDIDAAGKRCGSVGIHLPPWWEIRERVSPTAVRQPRKSAINRPHVDRSVLFGEPLLGDLASRILSTVEDSKWISSHAENSRRARYPFTVAVHRDWLMTPRAELAGKMPRQLLHGAHQWNESVIEAHRRRAVEGGSTVAASDSGAGYESAPMGREETIVYFDLCRELIEAGWAWCAAHTVAASSEPPTNRRGGLADYLRGVKEAWLSSPWEGGPTPSFIIECCRRRVPRGVGIPIVGMSQCEPQHDPLDCSCPICLMMDEGLFGTEYVSLSGEHLEFDQEFAFSLYESRTEWKEMLEEFGGIASDCDLDPHSDLSRPERLPGDEDLASAWSGTVVDDPLPGDRQGHLKLALLLAEIVSQLESLSAPESVIRKINAEFIDFRRCNSEQGVSAAERFNATLQAACDQFPSLIAKAADFQSRIDEQLRSFAD